jgi:hypothetical protein
MIKIDFSMSIIEIFYCFIYLFSKILQLSAYTLFISLRFLPTMYVNER